MSACSHTNRLLRVWVATPHPAPAQVASASAPGAVCPCG